MPESWPGLDAAHLARGPVAPCGNPAHRRPLAREEDGLGVALVGLMGVGVAGREECGEEQHHPEKRGADPAHVLQARHRSRSVTGCHCPGRDSAIPSRAARSIGSRCIDLSPLQILRDLSLSLRHGRLGGTSRPWGYDSSVCIRCASSAVDVRVRLPPGRPPEPEGERRRSRRPGPVAVRRPDPVEGSVEWLIGHSGGGRSDGAAWPAEAMRRRPIRASPARPMPAISTMGSGPAQNSPVCTLVTSGTAGRGWGRRRDGRRDRGRGGDRRRRRRRGGARRPRCPGRARAG